MAEDEGFEPPQTESESGVLPLHKSSKLCGAVQRLLLYTYWRKSQVLFPDFFIFLFSWQDEKETFGSIAARVVVYTGKEKNMVFPLPVSGKAGNLFRGFSAKKLPGQFAVLPGKTAKPLHNFAFSSLTGKRAVN